MQLAAGAKIAVRGREGKIRHFPRGALLMHLLPPSSLPLLKPHSLG